MKKFENLSEMESKVVKILEENKGKAFDFIEMIELVYNWDRQQGGSIKEYLLIFGGHLALNTILDNLLRKEKISIMIAKGKDFYYIK